VKHATSFSQEIGIKKTFVAIMRSGPKREAIIKSFMAHHNGNIIENPHQIDESIATHSK
jgi:hypothetical protein